MKTKNGILGLFTLIFLGCATPSKKIKTTYNESNNEGMIVGTICIENKTFNSYTFIYADDIPAVADYANMSDNFTYKNSPGDF